MDQKTREAIRTTVRTLRELGCEDRHILDVLCGDTGSAPRPAVAPKSPDTARKAKPVAPPRARKAARIVARTGRPSRQGLPQTLEVTLPGGKTETVTVTNYERGVFCKDAGKPNATFQEVAEAKRRPGNRWTLAGALIRQKKRKALSASPRKTV